MLSLWLVGRDSAVIMTRTLLFLLKNGGYAEQSRGPYVIPSWPLG